LIPTITIGGINVISTIIDFAIPTLVYVLVALTVNLEFGYTGIPNFGKVLFVAGGGLISGSLSFYLMAYILGINSSDPIANQFRLHDLMDSSLVAHPALDFALFLFMIVVGASVGAALGFVASYPAIKLREDYLGMLLLAAGEFFLIFVQAYYPITGGSAGLLTPDILGFTGSQPEYREVVLLGLLAVFTVGVYFYAERVARSPLGRTLRAVRDNETSSEALGKNNVAIRRNILIVSSAICGIAGVLVVTQQAYISPETFVRTFYTFYPFVIVILGGAANNFGVVIGAIVFEGVIDLVSNVQTYAQINSITLPVDLNAVTYIAIGVLLIVILLWRPKGLIAEKPTLTLNKADLLGIMHSSNNKDIEEVAEESKEPDDENNQGG
jgi:branched-chain amino acid transport system permease protein